MAEHTDATTIANLRETVRRQQLDNDAMRVSALLAQAELAELRRLVDPFGETGDDVLPCDKQRWMTAILEIRDHKRKVNQ